MLPHQLLLINKSKFSIKGMPGEHFKFQQNGKSQQVVEGSVGFFSGMHHQLEALRAMYVTPTAGWSNKNNQLIHQTPGFGTFARLLRFLVIA